MTVVGGGGVGCETFGRVSKTSEALIVLLLGCAERGKRER
jgi:hypothetical protein